MGVLDFLFEGRPPASVTTYGQTINSIPSWLSDYTQGLLSRANSTAAEPYQTYGGPRVAGFTPLQQAAQQQAANNVGVWKPGISAAQSVDQGIATNGAGALSQAAPYLNAGTGSYTDQVDKYMSPFTENVIDRATMLANRNLTEKLLPSINSNFIKAGAYGSAGQQRAVGQALRDTTEGVQSQAAAQLADAYNNGANQFNAEAGRNIQAGQTAGQLAGTDVQARLAGAQGLGALAQNQAQLSQADVGALAAAGSDQQQLNQRNLDLAYSDFQNQRDYPKSQVDWISNIIRGIPNQGNTISTANTGPASVYQPSTISQLGSLISLYKGLSDDGKARGGLAIASRYARGGRVQKRLPAPRKLSGVATMRRISNGV